MFSHYATRKISPICKISTFSEDFSFLNPRSHLKRNREWRQNNLKILEPTTKPQNKRLEGGGRKPLDQQLENQLV